MFLNACFTGVVTITNLCSDFSWPLYSIHLEVEAASEVRPGVCCKLHIHLRDIDWLHVLVLETANRVSSLTSCPWKNVKSKTQHKISLSVSLCYLFQAKVPSLINEISVRLEHVKLPPQNFSMKSMAPRSNDTVWHFASQHLYLLSLFLPLRKKQL